MSSEQNSIRDLTCAKCGVVLAQVTDPDVDSDACCKGCLDEAEERIEKLEKDLAEQEEESSTLENERDVLQDAQGERDEALRVIVEGALGLALRHGADLADCLGILEDLSGEGDVAQAVEAGWRRALEEHLAKGGNLFNPRSRDPLREHNAAWDAAHPNGPTVEALLEQPKRKPRARKS